MSNSTFYDNHAGEGAAINGGITDITVTNSTFAGNTATYGGDTIANGQCGNCEPGRVLLQNSIFADDGLYFSCEGPAIIDGGGNLSYSDFSCPGIQRNAVLGPLQNNGGPTPTMALGAGSAAIDAANNATCAASPVNNLDQRGVTRPIDGDGNGTAICDIGAVEQQPAGAPRQVIMAEADRSAVERVREGGGAACGRGAAHTTNTITNPNVNSCPRFIFTSLVRVKTTIRLYTYPRSGEPRSLWIFRDRPVLRRKKAPPSVKAPG